MVNSSFRSLIMSVRVEHFGEFGLLDRNISPWQVGQLEEMDGEGITEFAAVVDSRDELFQDVRKADTPRPLFDQPIFQLLSLLGRADVAVDQNREHAFLVRIGK